MQDFQEQILLQTLERIANSLERGAGALELVASTVKSGRGLNPPTVWPPGSANYISVGDIVADMVKALDTPA